MGMVEQFAVRDLRPDVPMLDDSHVLEVYSDGVATIERLGPNIRLTYFTWGHVRGSSLVQRVPVIKVTRPTQSFLANRGGLLAVLPVAERLARN